MCVSSTIQKELWPICTKERNWIIWFCFSLINSFVFAVFIQLQNQSSYQVLKKKKHSDFLHEVWQRIMKRIFFPYRFIHPDSRLDICLQYLCTCNPYHRSPRASFRCRLKLSSQISCPLKVAEKILLNVSFSLITWGIVANWMLSWFKKSDLFEGTMHVLVRVLFKVFGLIFNSGSSSQKKTDPLSWWNNTLI